MEKELQKETYTFEKYLNEHSIENTRIGTEIDQNGKIWAKYKNGNRQLIAEIPMPDDFFAPGSTEKIESNLFRQTLNSGGFDGVGVSLIDKGIQLTRTNKTQANTIIKSFLEDRKTETILSVEGGEGDSYFILSDGNSNIYTKTLSLYVGGYGGDIEPETISTFNEKYNYGPAWFDKNGNMVQGWKVNEAGEVIQDSVTTLIFGERYNYSDDSNVNWNLPEPNIEDIIEYYLDGIRIAEDGKVYGIYVSMNEGHKGETIEKLIFQIAISKTNTEISNAGAGEAVNADGGKIAITRNKQN